MQQAAAQQRLFSAAPAAPGRRSAAAHPARVSSNGAGPVAKLAEGARVRVTAPVKVYHVGKFKAGLELQGMEATVVQPDVRDYRHHDGKQHELSANLPIKVGRPESLLASSRLPGYECVQARGLAAGRRSQATGGRWPLAPPFGTPLTPRRAVCPAPALNRRSSSWCLAPMARTSRCWRTW